MSKSAVDRWVNAAAAIFAKEVRCELRTRYALGTVSLFSLTTVAAISLATSSASMRSDVKAALLWIVLLFAAMSGLSRVFVREEETGNANVLRLSAPPTAVYAGKLLYNVLIVFAVETVSVPLFLALLPPQTVHVPLFLLMLVFGGWGLAAAATFVAALISQAQSGKSALFFIVAFPVLMPLLLIAVHAAQGTFSMIHGEVLRAGADVWILATYAVVSTTASLLLFDTIWYE